MNFPFPMDFNIWYFKTRKVVLELLVYARLRI